MDAVMAAAAAAAQATGWRSDTDAVCSVQDTDSVVIQVSAVSSSLSGGHAVKRETRERERRKIREMSYGFRPDGEEEC